MKKLLSILLIVALVLILGACNSSPENNNPSPETPIVKPGVLDPNDPYYADGLNDYGLPDLSIYTLEQLVDMYVHPDNWSASVLYMTDSSFSFDDEVYSEPEIDEEYHSENYEYSSDLQDLEKYIIFVFYHSEDISP